METSEEVVDIAELAGLYRIRNGMSHHLPRVQSERVLPQAQGPKRKCGGDADKSNKHAR